MSDFYATTAQIMPVILLALVWESGYVEQLVQQDRDPHFWTLRRVRVYMLSVLTAIVADAALCVLVLAGALGDSAALRAVVVVGAIWGMGTLLFRSWMHVLQNTAHRRPED